MFSQFRSDVINNALETDCEQADEESLGNKCMVLCLCKNDINSDVNEWIMLCSPTHKSQWAVSEHQLLHAIVERKGNK